MTVLAFDLGGTRLKAAAVDGEKPFSVLTAPSSLDAVVHVGRAVLDATPCSAVGMCVPGIVSAEGVVELLPGKLEGLQGRDLRAFLAEAFPGLAVGAVVNDAVAFGWTEASCRRGRRVLTVTIGTGLGTIVVNAVDGEVRGLLTGQAWEESCRSGAVTDESLTEALVAMCFAHEPDVVAVGGGGADQVSLDAVEEAVNERLAPWLSVAVEPAASGDAGGVVGVAMMSEARLR